MVAQRIECDPDGFGLRQRGVGIALRCNQLAAHFACGQAGIKPLVAKLGIGLALAVYDGLDVGKQGRQMRLGRLASAQGKGILTGNACGEFMGSLADAVATPSEFALGQALSAGAKFSDGTGHEHPLRAAFERACGLDKERFETFGEFHGGTPAWDSWLFHISWKKLIIESP